MSPTQRNTFTGGAVLQERGARPAGQAGSERRPAAPPVAAPLSPDGRAWLGLFGGPALPAAAQAMLVMLARTRTVPAGATVFDHRDVATALVLAQSGHVALGHRGADGVFRIERALRGPAWLDQSAAWLRRNHAMDARASTEATIVELPCDALQVQLERHPGLARRLVTSLAREVQSLSINTHALMHMDAPARFAAWLVQRLDAACGSPGRVQLDERKRDIASQLAITPETLSRLMRSLAGQGVIAVAGYSVQVLDVAALRRLATGV
jgi:CRP/FNR family transcriptional regulator, dissimilatory nitrate respiration regulator